MTFFNPNKRAEFQNILVVRTDRIGDVVLTTPSLRAIKKQFPEARLSVWVSESTRSLVEGLSFVDQVIVEDRERGFKGYVDVISRLRQNAFDLAVVYHTKKRVNAACWLAGIPLRLGYKNNKFGFLLNRPVKDERHLGEKHEAQYCLDLLQEVGVVSQDLTLEVATTLKSEAWAEDVFEKDFANAACVLAIHPDASCATKRWPIKRFVELSDLLVERLGARVVLVGGPGAKELSAQIESQVKSPVVNLTGELSLAQLVSFLKRVKVLVSNDSGPVHVASAVGTAVVSLFLRVQPGLNPERWRPLGGKTAFVVNRAGEEVLVDKHSQVTAGNFSSIEPQEVLRKVQEVMS